MTSNKACNPLIIAALFSSISSLFGGGDKPPYDLADVYLEMRREALGLNEDKMGELKGEPVWAVLMETGYPEAAVSLIGDGDGAASLYISNGGGIIGAGEHNSVRPVSLEFVKLAEEYVEKMESVEAYPTVSPGNTTFYVVTPNGVFDYTAKEVDLGEERDALSPLFHQGHELIGQMQIVERTRQ